MNNCCFSASKSSIEVNDDMKCKKKRKWKTYRECEESKRERKAIIKRIKLFFIKKKN